MLLSHVSPPLSRLLHASNRVSLVTTEAFWVPTMASPPSALVPTEATKSSMSWRLWLGKFMISEDMVCHRLSCELCQLNCSPNRKPLGVFSLSFILIAARAVVEIQSKGTIPMHFDASSKINRKHEVKKSQP